MNRIRSLVVSLCALALIGAPTLSSPARAPLSGSLHGRLAAGAPRFEGAPCPFKPGAGIVVGKDVRCGYLVVPANRARPTGPAIRLAVAIYKSSSAHPAPDPVIFLQGGPGGALLSAYAPIITNQTASILVGDRDLVLFDQRGTGYSRPALDCRELTAVKYRILDQRSTPAREATLNAAASRQCHDRLVRSGINLDDYNSLADAADVADLRLALGYERVNLYGVSYGTRLALTTMRTHPAGIRGVVLDSVYPPEANLFTGPLSSLRRSFDVLFAGCAADATCGRVYPHLQSTFYDLVARLDAHPATFQTTSNPGGKRYTVLLTGGRLADLLFQTLYVTPFIPVLPKAIYTASNGNYDLVSKLYGTLEFDDSIALGQYYSFECGEDAPFVTPAQVRAAGQALSPRIRAYEVSSSLSDLGVCRGWGVRGVPAAQKAAVTSGIPTLVLSGQYDPITPPAGAMRAAQTLSHSYFFQYPGMGHGVFLYNLCPYRMTESFLDDPTHRPDASCIAKMGPPQFTTIGSVPGL